MKGDFSRNTFDPTKHYCAVLKQQGRVDVDADWNEQQLITLQRCQAEARDVIGSSGAPTDYAGFKISELTQIIAPKRASTTGPAATAKRSGLSGIIPIVPLQQGANFMIGAGRYYVDGIVCENETAVSYARQPNGTVPSQPDFSPPLITEIGYYLVYLDVWLRHITALDDENIREKALGGPDGGPDTATRARTVWQVKVLPVQYSQPLRPIGEVSSIVGVVPLPSLPNCSTVFNEWDSLNARRSGKLNVRTTAQDTVDQVCLLPPSSGYQRLENQLYRVEIHESPTSGTPTFVWSRDNGTVVVPIKSISGNTLSVDSVGLDDVLGFAMGQWVEIIDDTSELNGTAGPLVQIESVDQDNGTITTKTSIVSPSEPIKPKLRRWDQSRDTSSGGALVVTYDWQPLEAGIEVKFAQGSYNIGDYWLIPARAATSEVEWPLDPTNRSPIEQPPLGIYHSYSKLALIYYDGITLKFYNDCRKLFQPLIETRPDPVVPAMHVVNINWPNDDVVHFDDNFLTEGLQISFDTAIDPSVFAVHLKTQSCAALVVSIDASFSSTEAPSIPTPTLNIALPGTTALLSENTIKWLPIETTYSNLYKQLNSAVPAMIRVALKGAFLWSAGTNVATYLDGKALGIPGQGSNSGGTPRIDLRFPSGIGVPASDFESWFYLVLAPPKLIDFSINPSSVSIAEDGTIPTADGTIKLDRVAPSEGVTVQLQGKFEKMTINIPPNVNIKPGSSITTFTIVPSKGAQAGNHFFSAKLGEVEKPAVLTIVDSRIINPGILI